MRIKPIYYSFLALTAICITFAAFQSPNNNENFSEKIKVVLRDAGNKLLLANRDSSSLILPIRKVKENRYEIAFEGNLSITPDSLVAIVNSSLQIAKLPKRYIVEVINCNTLEVSYSFQITGTKEQNIVPCLGRVLPLDCYTVQVLFIENDSFMSANKNLIIIGLLILILTLVAITYFKRKPKTNLINKLDDHIKIGNYKFYEAQNKLVKDAVEIKLSTKECELMNMFSSQQNQVIKRDVLIKKIWEDNGVFVGRSLDTFISKLRKKFKDDDSINIINVHGVGYKLEVN
jgi:hypothetical protein